MTISKSLSMVSDSRLDAEKYHSLLLAIESATLTIDALEREGRASIEEVLAILLPNLTESLAADQAFAAILRASRGRQPKGFEIVLAYPKINPGFPFLPWTDTLAKVVSDDRAHMIEPFVDDPKKLIPGLEIFNATTAILVKMKIGDQTWLIGVYNRAKPELGSFLETDRRTFESIVKLIAIGLRVGIRRSQLKTAQEIAETVGTGLSLETTLGASMQILHKVFDNTRMCVLLYLEDINALKFAPGTLEYYKIPAPAYRKQETFPLDGKSVACRVAKDALQTGNVEYVNVGDVKSNPDYLPIDPKTRSELCISLMSTKDELLGVLVMESYNLHGLDHVDEELVKTVAQQLSSAIEFAQQSEELEFRTTVAARTSWAADMAHDINNEVAQIRNWAYMLRERLKDNPDLQEYAKKIEESASVISSSGPWSESPPEVVKLDLVLTRYAKKLSDQRNLPIDFHLNAKDIYIRINPVYFERVLRHLIRNASRAMVNSKVRKIIITTNTVSDSTVEILFQDTGPGISGELQLSIFQRPITTKNTGGFGLLLVRQMIEDMGGQIRYITQKKGHGAMFSILFPIVSVMDGAVD
jgi:GAF domain-containing protein